MKKYLAIILLFAIITVLFCSCKKIEESSAPAETSNNSSVFDS